MSFYSKVVYPTGGAGTYAVTFPYIDKAHVSVLDNGIAYTGAVTWPTAGTISLSPDIASGRSVTIMRTTPRDTTLVSFQPGSLSSGDLNLEDTQLLYIEQETLDGAAVTGVASVNGRAGAVILAASDVAIGFGSQVASSLAAGLNVTLSTVAGITTVAATGGGGGDVSSVNTRTGAVVLTAADVASGFGAAVASALAAGAGASLVTSGGITTIAAAVTSVAGKTGAVTLGTTDIGNFGTGVGAALAAGPNISIATVAGVTTITASLSGSGASSSSFIGQTVGADFNTTQSLTWPLGTNVGDMAVLFQGILTGTPVVPTDWTLGYAWAGGGGANSVTISWKVLAAADITAGHTPAWAAGTSANQVVLVYRGPTQLSSPAAQIEHASPDTLAGFVKNSHNIGTLAAWVDHLGNTLGAGPASPFASRLAPTGGSVIQFAAYDAIGASVYPDSTNETFTWAGVQTASAVMFELRNDGVGAAPVSSVNGRTGAVTLAGADVTTGLGAAVYSKLVAGANVALSVSGDTITIASTGGGGGGVSSVNTRTGAVVLTAADVSSGFGTAVAAALAAGTNVSLSTSGGVTTISSSGGGGGGVPQAYQGAFENNIKTANSATTNTTNLNALIATLAAAGGGTIWFNESGNYPINGTITLKSGVSFQGMWGGRCQFSWSGSNSGDIFHSLSTEVLIGLDTDIVIDEGSSFGGNVLYLHSCQHNHIRMRGLGTSASSVFAQIVADSTAGEFSGGGRNVAFNVFEFFHRGLCGHFLFYQGIPGGGGTFGGDAQGVTLNTFHNCQANNVAVVGFQLEQWADSNTFTGNTYAGVSGSGGIGFIANEAGAALRTVYNTRLEQLAIDNFGSGLGRYGVVLNLSAGMYCGAYFNDPAAENGSFIGNNCNSYYWAHMRTGSDDIFVHQKNFSTGL
jgi:hypothetical protein